MKDLLVLIGYESDNDFANGFADIINKLKNIKTMVSIKNKCYEQRFSSAGLLYVYINGYKENEMIYSQIGEHTSELQSQSTISYAVFCLKKEQIGS